MGRRRDRLNKRLARQISTRRENSLRKAKESDRRDQQMVAILKKGSTNFTPGMMSWVSEKLGKQASKITQEDILSLAERL